MMKRKLKDLKNGEAIAIKIKKGKYKNKYLVLICCKESPEEERDFYFRAKLSKKLPTTTEEINKLPYIKVRAIHYIMRYLPGIGGETYEELVERKKHYVYYPDEYNYLYVYYFTLLFEKGDNLDDIIYLNIYNVERPTDEYVNDSKSYYREIILFNRLEEDLIEYYEDYNLKKDFGYTKVGQQRCEKNAKAIIEVLKKYDQIKIKNNHS